MKSHSATVLDVYDGIFIDASRIWPEARSLFGRDLSYLRRAVEQRGLAFFTLTLPSLGKVYDSALSYGSFSASQVPLGIPMIRSRPKLFGYLHMKVFDDSGVLRPDACTLSVSFLRQLCMVAGKLRVECEQSRTKETLDEFFRIESSMLPPWPSTWDSDVPEWCDRVGHPLHGDVSTESDTQQLSFLDIDPSDPYDWDSLRLLCRRVIHSFGIPDWWSFRPKHGPGVVSEQDGFVSKYEFPNWPRKLERWFPFEWFGSGVIDDDYRPSERELPSRLIAVPKSAKGPRLICAEPLSHQWMQQAIREWLEERVDSSLLGRSITFRSQERSRKGALNASRDRMRCTIDLSSASDRLSCRLVEYVFQGSPILDGLHAARTRYLKQNLSGDHPSMIVLKKFSTQGSAVTFPVQSIVFALLAVYALRVSEGRQNDWKNLDSDFDRVTVFGDDIIAPNHAFTAISSLFENLGLKVNPLKSFHEGNFRESCGMDAFNGVDVTPARLLESYDGSATSMAATIETSNNFYKRGYWATSHVVLSQLSEQERKLLPVVGKAFSEEKFDRNRTHSREEVRGLGLFSFQGGSVEHLSYKWNDRLQRREYIALQVISKITKEQGTGLSGLTQYFTERPRPDTYWSSGQVRTVRTRKVRTRITP